MNGWNETKRIRFSHANGTTQTSTPPKNAAARESFARPGRSARKERPPVSSVASSSACAMARAPPYQTASGTVRTVDGLPVATATVRAYRIRYGVLGRRMKIVKTALTNDLGDFRLFGLEPGDYYFSASYSERSRDIPLFGATLTPNLSNPDAGYVTRYFPDAVSPPDAAVVTMARQFASSRR